MHHEADRAAVTGVFNLRDVFELVNDRLDNSTLSQQEFVAQKHQLVLHVGFEPCDQFNTLRPQLVVQGFGDVAFVAKELAPQPFDQSRHGLAVIDIAGRDPDCQQFTAVIDDEMQLDTKEPAHRCLPARCPAIKDLVTVNPSIVTDGERGGIDKGDATPVTAAALQKHTKWFEKRGQQLNEPFVADELGKFSTQVDLHILGVVGLEIPIPGLMKVDHDGHHLAFTQFSRSYPLPLSARQQLLSPHWRKRLPEIIDAAEQFQ